MSFCYINAEIKTNKNEFFPFQIRKRKNKSTSPANEFLLHKCRTKMIFFFSFPSSNLKKITNKLASFSYKGIGKKKEKKSTSLSIEFLLYIGESEKLYKSSKLVSPTKVIRKNAQVHPMSFRYIG